VEDEVLIQMLAADFLEEAGFTIATAGSATEAMNKLGLMPCSIDAVILDLGLPDRPGEQVFREIRALHPLLPIVLATGQGASTLRATFKDERHIAHVTKPYDAGKLVGALRALGIGKGGE
jgi:DNA-binding response OmpR family regulator